MVKLKFSGLLLIFALLVSLPLADLTFAQTTPLGQPTTSFLSNQLAATLESETKKLAPLSTPSVTINPQPTAQTPPSKPFWAFLSRCFLFGGLLSCTSAAVGVVILVVIIFTGLWLKKSRYKSTTKSNR